MNQIKFQIRTDDRQNLLQQVFGKSGVTVGEEVEVDNQITVVNMSDGAEGVAGSDVLMFVVEHSDAIAASIAANMVYDLTKAGASAIWINGKRILGKSDAEAAVTPGD